MIVGCQQFTVGELMARKHLEEANKKIRAYIEILENPKADRDDQEDILCLKFPKIYKYEYLPALLRFSKLKVLNIKPKDQLLRDFKNTTDSYSKKLGIKCD
ncbi:hypothetical protein EGT62_09080 [Acinetobacter junii]|nr:hypothetical protein EGT62_09080 [Acinetobacter junii]